MKTLVSGTGGLVGSALLKGLAANDHQTHRLVRNTNPASQSDVVWDPSRGVMSTDALEGVEAVIHLAGENIAGGRWNAARKASIRDSRVVGTRSLVDSCLRCRSLPQVFLCASAIGFYGDTGDTVVDESAPAGSGFLAEVCTAWEDATRPLADRGVRVVNLRFGVALSPAGGTLQKLLTPFRLGLGGRVGDGRQYFSWISLDDAIGAILHTLTDAQAIGPMNLVAPGAVTNSEFTAALARALNRPAILPLPAFVARTGPGRNGPMPCCWQARASRQRVCFNWATRLSTRK